MNSIGWASIDPLESKCSFVQHFIADLAIGLLLLRLFIRMVNKFLDFLIFGPVLSMVFSFRFGPLGSFMPFLLIWLIPLLMP